MNKISLCYILSYYSPKYVRTKTLLAGINSLPIKTHLAINKRKSFLRYIETISKVLYIRFRFNPPLYILGFRGHEIFPIIRLLTFGKTLVFDQMMSPYDSLINEKHIFSKNSTLGKLLYVYEKAILHHSDVVITDTIIHKQYFEKLYTLPQGKITAIHVGAEEEVFFPSPIKKEPQNTLTLLYYGSFLPLHGIKTLISAATILKNDPVHFVFVGGKGKQLEDFSISVKSNQLTNVEHISWIDYKNLPKLIDSVDIGLGGPFGNTGQANRVITGKTFQFLAKGKPVIIGGISYDYGFQHKENCLLVPQANENELVHTIRWCLENRGSLSKIGLNGYRLYKNNFSVNQNIKAQLKKILL